MSKSKEISNDNIKELNATLSTQKISNNDVKNSTIIYNLGDFTHKPKDTKISPYVTMVEHMVAFQPKATIIFS